MIYVMLGYYGHSRYLPFLDPYSWTYPIHFTRLPGVVSLGTEILVVVSKIPMEHGPFTNGLPFKKLLPEGWELPSPTNGGILENILRCFCLVKGTIFCTWFWMIVTVGFSIDQMVNWKLQDFQRTTDYCLKFQTSRHLNILICFPLVVDHKKEFFHVYPAFWPKWHTKFLPRRISEFLKQKHWFRRNKSSCADTIGLSEGFPGGSARGYTDRFHKFHEFQRDTCCEVPGSTWGGRDTGGAGRHGPWSPSDGRLGFLVKGVVPAKSWLKGGVKSLVLLGFIFFHIFYVPVFV